MYPEVAGSRRSGKGDGVRPPIKPPDIGLMTPTARHQCLPVGVFFFGSAPLAIPRHAAGAERVAARSRLIMAVAFATGTCAGGCATVDRPVQSSPSTATANATSSTSLATAATVRAQSGEAAASPVAAGSAVTTTPAPAAVVPDGPTGGALDPPAGGALTAPIITVPIDTALESLFGEASTTDWSPLLLSELFTVGWNQPFVFSPPSDSGALRQEWINSANGVFYRQWVLDYNFRDHVDPSGNRDIGTWSVFAPLSRRLELFISIPFVDYHRVADPMAASGDARSIKRGERDDILQGDIRRHEHYASGLAPRDPEYVDHVDPHRADSHGLDRRG